MLKVIQLKEPGLLILNFFFKLHHFVFNGLPRWLSGKEFICQCRKCRRSGLRSLDWEDALEEEMATHSSILAWESPWTEEPGGLQFGWSQRVLKKKKKIRILDKSSPHGRYTKYQSERQQGWCVLLTSLSW